MNSKTLKYIILLAVISVAGVFLIQFGFLKSSYNFSEKQFQESATVALKEVAWQILLAKGETESFDSLSPVGKVTGNLYHVKVNTDIEVELLKHQLIDQFNKHDIYTDFEFAVFNKVLEQMDPGILIRNGKEYKSKYNFEANGSFDNYFMVHFPNRFNYFTSQLSIWYLLTGLLLIVLFYFGYTLTVILRQRQLSEVQKNFINNLTHELKTPISSIALSASVINDPEILKTPDRLFRYAKIIEEQNQRLAKNVEKVLNLASVEKSRIQLALEEMNLVDLLNEIITQFKLTDFGQKADLHFKAEMDKQNIVADRFHFSNLVMNILENGVKYCDKNPVLNISVKSYKGKINVQFADNGIGIPKDQRRKIFTKFYRVPTGNVHNVKGFGLGLDYVQKIVTAHRWKIKVDENPAGGSIFTLIIPFER